MKPITYYLNKIPGCSCIETDYGMGFKCVYRGETFLLPLTGGWVVANGWIKYEIMKTSRLECKIILTGLLLKLQQMEQEET